MTSKGKIDLPKLVAPVTAVTVKAWLDTVDDAFEAYTLLYPDHTLTPATRILLAGLKLEAPEASQWWNENRVSLKALATYAEFSTKVQERFMPSGWKMDALATFYAIRQRNLPFVDFVSSLQSARGILGTAGTGYKISDTVFKHHLLLCANPLLSLRVRAIPGLAFDTIRVDALIGMMASTWSSMVAEGAVRNEPVTLPASKGPQSRSELTQAEYNDLKTAGGCYRCRKTPASPGWTPHTSKTCPGDPALGISPARTTSGTVASIATSGLLGYPNDSDEDDDEDYLPVAGVTVAYAGDRPVDDVFDSDDDL